METGKAGSAGLMQQISLSVMKKAMEVESNEVLSVLQSSAMQTPAQQRATPPHAIADLTGLGQKIDIKA